MPRVFQVLKCYQCLVFQVHQTKKSNKFACKMCGEKQSIKRHYGVGNGQECRIHVQKLNGIRGEILETSDNQSECSDQIESEEKNHAPNVKEITKKIDSKWADYISNCEITQPSDQNQDKMFLNDREVVLEIPSRKRQRKKACSFKTPSKSLENSNLSDMMNDIPCAEKKICTNNKTNKTNHTAVSSTSKYDNVLSDYNKTYKRDASINYDYGCTLNETKNIKSNHKHSDQVKTKVEKNSKWNKFKDESDDEHSEMLENDSSEEQFSPQMFEDKHLTNFALEQCNSDTDSYKCGEEISNTKTIPYKVADSKSKRAEYDEYNETTNNKTESENELGLKHNSQNKCQALFSLCNDENEIDDVLDI